MDVDFSSQFLGKDGGRSEVSGDDDDLASRKLLDSDFLDRECLKLGGELLEGEGGEPFFLRGGAG